MVFPAFSLPHGKHERFPVDLLLLVRYTRSEIDWCYENRVQSPWPGIAIKTLISG